MSCLPGRDAGPLYGLIPRVPVYIPKWKEALWEHKASSQNTTQRILQALNPVWSGAVALKSLPSRKWMGGSLYERTSLPLKNLFPNCSVFTKVPYFAMPISQGVNSTHSMKERNGESEEQEIHYYVSCSITITQFEPLLGMRDIYQTLVSKFILPTHKEDNR